MLGDEAAHPGLGLGRELPAEPVVEVADHVEWIGDERREVHVDELLRRRTSGRAHPCRGRARGRCRRCSPGGLLDRRLVAGHGARWADSALTDATTLSGSRCVCTTIASGYSAGERVQAPQVRRRLQQPLLGRDAGTGGAGGSGGATGRRAPGPPRRAANGCRRHAVLRREDHAAEVADGDADALLGELRAHRVEVGEAREDRVDHVEVRLHLADARIGLDGWPSGAGTGRSTSQVSGARSCGSCASRSWRIVVPVRGWPTMTSGCSIVPAATSGWSRRHALTASRLPR